MKKHLQKFLICFYYNDGAGRLKTKEIEVEAKDLAAAVDKVRLAFGEICITSCGKA